MKIIGKDGREYKSVEECEKADELYEKEQEEKIKAASEADKKEITAESKRKKELSDKINDASERVAHMREQYTKALNKAREIKREANEKAEQILRDAYKNAEGLVKEAAKDLENASEDRMNAVIDFNKEFGKYREYHEYTGREAVEQYNKVIEEFNHIFAPFNDLFRDSFWRW